ncbi:MAG: tetratricopeptide repeat protein [Bacteroidota bacterium]
MQNFLRTICFFTLILIFTPSCKEGGPLLADDDNQEKVDTTKMRQLYDQGYNYVFSNPDSTIILADSLLKLSGRQGYEPGKFNAFRLKGIVDAIQGKYEEALTHFDQARNLTRAMNDSTHTSVILTNIGNVYLYMSRHARALEKYRQALAIDRKMGDRKGEANNLNNMAATYNEMGSYRKALDYYLEALRIKEKVSEKSDIASTTMNIALMQQELKRFDKAREYLKRSENLMQETNDRIGLAKCENIKGLIHKATGQHNRAQKSFQEALEINRDMDMPDQIAINLRNLAKNEMQQQNYQSAEKYALESAEVESRTTDISGKGETQQILAGIYLAQERENKALKHAKIALKTGQQHNDKALLRDASKTMSKILETQGNWNKALHYHKQFTMYADSLFNSEIQKETERMEARYDFEKKELELKNEQKIKEARYQQKVTRRTQLFYFSLTAFVFLGIVAIGIYRSRIRIKQANKHISRQKQEIEEQTQELEEANEKLKELTRFKEEISNMIIHDLKNPLGIILMLSKEVPDQQKTEMIQDAAKRMLNMVMNILDINKYENAKLKLEFSEAPVKDILEEAIKEQEYNLKMKSLHIIRKDNSNPVVRLDAGMIKRVMENLLDNAVKYSPYNDPVQIAIDEEEDRVKITVSNKGPGIPPEKTKLIFEPYGQARSRGIGMIKSTGLGLAFCKMAISAHNGEIGVESTPNEWTSFWFTIPKG